jgi:(p)ppGpp synthase/HD superfamily hydrolase
MPSLDETIAFIRQVHAGQTDKSGADYAEHPIAAMRRLPEGVDDAVRHAALLHDVIEDTCITRADLQRRGYSERVLAAVDLVTQAKDDIRPYGEKIAALIASGNADALEVKLADMSENTAPERLARLDPERRAFFEQKYAQPLQALRKALGRDGEAISAT